MFFLLLSISYVQIFAIGSPYSTGATLDPACVPGETNCIVQIIPAQASNSGKLLTTDGTTTSWTTCCGGVNSINALTDDVSIISGTAGSDFGIITAGSNITFNLPTASATNRGALSSANWSTFNAKENALTFSTGLTRSVNTITNNLSTGVSGGQSVIGSTLASENLTLSSTSHGTKGKIIFGTSGYDEVNNSLGIGTTSPTARLHLPAGTATTNTAPLKFDQGVILGTPEPGAIEFDGYNLYYTDNDMYRFQITPIKTFNSTSLFGPNAGVLSTAINSNFFGDNAGNGATYAEYSNFFGQNAGKDAVNAEQSNFFGQNAGNGATNVQASNFLGGGSGAGAIDATYSNFIGYSAGGNATNASYSTFIGSSAGANASKARNSIFIGFSAGINEVAIDNTGNVEDFSILIGKSTSTGGFSNSIAIGGSATNTASNEFMIGSTTRYINTVVIKTSSGDCLIDSTGIACPSDIRRKTNINDLPSILDTLQNVKTVTYNWINNPNGNQQIGFIAQNLEQYFPQLVATDKDGMKSVYYSQMTPVLTEAIKELDLKIKGISSSANNSVSIPQIMSDFFASVVTNVSGSVAYMKDLVVDTLKIGGPEKRTGITFYDESTGDPYCMSINNGQQKIVQGECSVINPVPAIIPTVDPIQPIETILPIDTSTTNNTDVPIVDTQNTGPVN